MLAGFEPPPFLLVPEGGLSHVKAIPKADLHEDVPRGGRGGSSETFT